MPKVKKFDTKTIKNLKLPSSKGQVDHFEHLHEGRSLILTINKSGKRTWSTLFYERSRPRRKKLGEYPDMGCGEARKAAVKFDADKALASAKAGTFEKIAETYLKRHVKKEGLRSENEITRLLKTHAYPAWGKRRFAEIGRTDVADLLDAIEDRRGAGVANSTLAVIRGLMNWHQTRDGSYVTPIVPGMRRKKVIKRVRWLSDDEVRELWNACEEAATFGAICRVLLLSGQRRTKVQTMKWSEVDLETGAWTIPREEREKGTPKAITLPQMALEIVRAQPHIVSNPYVFAGRGKAAFNAWSQSKRRLDSRLNIDEPWRIHDLRRTARKLMTRAKVQTEVAELALGHSLKGIQAVYDDPDEYLPDIDKALVKVEAEIRIIIRPRDGNIVQMRQR